VTALLACFILILSSGPVLPAKLPPPDYDAIKRAAQRVDKDREYVDSLPERLAECMETAESYASSMSVDDMVESTFIQEACLRAMMRKLAELYFAPGAFESGGIDARIEELGKPLYMIFEHFSVMGPECGGHACGSIADVLTPRAQYVSFLRELAELMAIYAANGHGRAEFHDAWIKAAQFK
jgi:hypothetical protein